MKVAVWANSPSPHQSDFYAALRRRGIDLKVLYLEHLASCRIRQGWSEPEGLPPGEMILPHGQPPIEALADWRERIHVIPGYSRRTHRRAVVQLSRAGVPWVHWSERSRPVWRAAFTWTVKRWYARWVNRAALGAFAQGDMAESDFHRWGIRPEKIAHLYYAAHGVPANTRPDPKTAEFIGSKTAFVYVGRLSSAKGCGDLLQAFAHAAGDGADTVLILVGGGPRTEYYRRTARRLGIADRVLFRGVVPFTVVASVLVGCHALVHPSRYDGWGMVLNEGASAGLALIATDQTGAAYHVLQHGWNGIRVKAGDVPALAAAIGDFASDRACVALRGRRSRMLFRQFTPEENVSRFVSAVRRWLAGDPRWRDWPGDRLWHDQQPSAERPVAA